MIADVKIIPLSIKIIFFAARARITIIATNGAMIGIFFDVAASSAGPARALLRSDGARVGLYLQGGSVDPLSGNRDGRRRLWT